MDVSAPVPCDSGDCNGYYGLTPVGNHGWEHFDDGTSLAAPIVSGVAALMLSANPALSPQELTDKLKASTDMVDFTDFPQIAGKLGAGRVNAYKALTEYGDIPAVRPDTTWANTVWVSGDLNTPSGSSLMIQAGTVTRTSTWAAGSSRVHSTTGRRGPRGRPTVESGSAWTAMVPMRPAASAQR